MLIYLLASQIGAELTDGRELLFDRIEEFCYLCILYADDVETWRSLDRSPHTKIIKGTKGVESVYRMTPENSEVLFMYLPGLWTLIRELSSSTDSKTNIKRSPPMC